MCSFICNDFFFGIQIEESILESLAWKHNSKLWKLIKQCEEGIPKEEEVALPSHVKSEPKQPIINEEPQTPSEFSSMLINILVKI